MIEKKILNLTEASMYTGFSKSYLYKLTHFRKIDHYKPNGKNIFFRIEDLDGFMLSGKREAISSDDISFEVSSYLLNS